MLGWSRMNGGSLSEPSSSKRQSRKSASARPALSVIFRKRAGTIWSVSTFSAAIGTTRLREHRERLAHVSARRSPRGVSMPGRRRGSLTTPLIALAAAVSGEARNVRPPLPWRPSKLRLLVLTAYWPGCSWSPFIAMHIEQPASRQSAPAALKISARPSRLGLALHLVAARDDHQPHAVGDVPVLEDGRREAQVADPAVGAAADEHDVDLLAEDRLAGLEVHVLQRVLERPPLGRVGLVVGRGDALRDRDAHARVRAVGDHRLEGVRVDRDRLVEGGAVVGRQRPPALDRRVPIRALRRVRTAVRGTRRSCRPGAIRPGASAALDAHVADRHPLFHGQRADGVAAVLEDVSGPAADPDPRDQVQDDVLGADARARAGRRRGPRRSSGRAGAGSGWRGPSRPRWSRSRTRAPRTRRACSCASRRTRSSCPAGSAPAAGR